MITHDDIGELVKKYRRGLVNSMLEFLILDIAEDEDVCGYDVITTLCLDFQVLLSPGQVYPVIDALELRGALEKERSGRRVLLRLTPLGNVLLAAWKRELGLFQLRLQNRMPSLERVT